MGVEAVEIKDEGGVDGRVDMRPDRMATLFMERKVKLLFIRNTSQGIAFSIRSFHSAKKLRFNQMGKVTEVSIPFL